MGARLENKVAIITGAGRGIGRAITYKMAHEGAMVALVDIDLESAQSAAEELRRQDCQALAVQTDITRELEAGSSTHGLLQLWDPPADQTNPEPVRFSPNRDK